MKNVYLFYSYNSPNNEVIQIRSMKEIINYFSIRVL